MSSPEVDKENGPYRDNNVPQSRSRDEKRSNHHRRQRSHSRGSESNHHHNSNNNSYRRRSRSSSRQRRHRDYDDYDHYNSRRSSHDGHDRRRRDDYRRHDHYDDRGRYDEDRPMRHPDHRHHYDEYRRDSRESHYPSDRPRDHRGPGEDRNAPSRPSTNHTTTTTTRRQPWPEYRVVATAKDERLGQVPDDPRGNDPTQRLTKKATSRGNGRNTESFDPASTLVRPDLRIHVGSNQTKVLDRPLKHDDVVIVPELFGPQQDWTLYYQLVDELKDIQAQGDSKGSEWISWHEGAHLICKNPTASPTFTRIIDRLCEYFHIRKESIGTRFNWYRDSSDWKPFHHDSAAFNPQRARNQNITVGVSFGATRELAFIRAEPLQNDDKVRIYFPQTNNGVFSFGRDANILWKHGINALPPEQQDGKGRISIILWGLALDVIEEEGSPPLLGSDGQGPHANHNNNQHHNKKRPHNNRRGCRGGEREKQRRISSSPQRDRQENPSEDKK